MRSLPYSLRKCSVKRLIHVTNGLKCGAGIEQRGYNILESEAFNDPDELNAFFV